MNPLTGALLTSLVMNVNLGGVAGMAFDPVTGVAYVADGGFGGTNMLYSLNTLTGTATLIGPLGINSGLAGLAFRGPAQSGVPDGGTSAVLLALAVAGLFGLHCAIKMRPRQGLG